MNCNMKDNYSFYATLTVSVFLDDNDFNFILDVCKNHYDSKIKSLQEHGGFLYGAKIRRTPYSDWIPKDKDRFVELNHNQLGLIIKSFEMLSNEQASRLNLLFHKIANEMYKNHAIVNKKLTELENL